jgi:hypothetical protein
VFTCAAITPLVHVLGSASLCNARGTSHHFIPASRTALITTAIPTAQGRLRGVEYLLSPCQHDTPHCPSGRRYASEPFEYAPRIAGAYRRHDSATRPDVRYLPHSLPSHRFLKPRIPSPRLPECVPYDWRFADALT